MRPLSPSELRTLANLTDTQLEAASNYAHRQWMHHATPANERAALAFVSEEERRANQEALRVPGAALTFSG